jgi:general stress protein YciG
MSGTPKGAKSFAQKKLAEDPDYFKKLAQRSRKPRGGKHTSGSFAKGSKRNQIAGSKGGKLSRRPSGRGVSAADINTSESVKFHKIRTVKE